MALIEAEKHFHRVRGCRGMDHLVDALNHHQHQLQLDNEVAVA